MLATDRVFHVHSVSKVYHMGDVEVRALRSVVLDLMEGEFVVFLGPSGSGSTLLNILGGLDTPSEGEVRFRDHVLSGADDRALTRFRREHVPNRKYRVGEVTKRPQCMAVPLA
jgi:putative ABC transport system ATP-binding protein